MVTRDYRTAAVLYTRWRFRVWEFQLLLTRWRAFCARELNVYFAWSVYFTNVLSCFCLCLSYRKKLTRRHARFSMVPLILASHAVVFRGSLVTLLVIQAALKNDCVVSYIDLCGISLGLLAIYNPSNIFRARDWSKHVMCCSQNWGISDVIKT